MSKQTETPETPQTEYYEELFSNLNEKLKRIISENDPSTLNNLIEAFLDRLRNIKDYTVFSRVGLADTLNQLYTQFSSQPPVCTSLFKLISTTSKIKTIQLSYGIQQEILRNFDPITQHLDVFTQALSAMAGLVYLNEKNQRAFSGKETISRIIQVGESNLDQVDLIEKMCLFFSNLSFKSAELKDVLFECGVIDFLMRILGHYSQKETKEMRILKQLFRAIGNCSCHASSIARIVQLKYLSSIKPLIKELSSEHFYLVKYSIDILSNLALLSANNKQVVHTLYEQGILDLLSQLINQFSINTEFICSCLDVFIGVLSHRNALEKALTMDFVQLLVKVLKVQQWNKNVVARCTQSLSIMSQQKQSRQQMLQLGVPSIISQILDRSSPDRSIFQQCYSLIRRLFNQKQNIEAMVQCVMSAFIYGSTPEQSQIQYLMWILISMIQKKVLSSIMLQSLMEPVVLNMNKYFKSSEKIVRLGIEILKSVIDEISIETSSYREFIEFSYKFLTRTNKLSYISYDSLVKSYLGLLARTITKLPILKIQLSNSMFLTILESWFKIAPLMDVEGLKEALDLLFFILLGNKKLSLEKLSKEDSIKFLKEPIECLLYRKDKSNKQAEVKLIESQKLQEYRLVAYKQNGKTQIKDKYSISLKNILIITFNYEQNQLVLEKSVFFQTGGIFVKDPVLPHCITVSGFDGDSPKHINIEFRTKETKTTFLKHIKNLLHLVEQG